MENNQTTQSSENLGVQVDAGFQDPLDGVVVPAEAEVLHLNFGDKSVYLEKPLLLGGQILRPSVGQSKRESLDRKYTINGVTKPKSKRRRCSVFTKKKTNVGAKTLKMGFRSKSLGFNYPTELLETSESNILFNIQINKCTVLPTHSKGVANHTSSDATQDNSKGGSEATKIVSFKPASPPIPMQVASASNVGSSDGYEDKHYNRNASNISATASILDEVVKKFSALAILEGKETDVADTGMKYDRVQTSPNHKLQENARSKNVLTDIKTIKESVSKSLSLCSSLKLSPTDKAEAVKTAEIKPACSGHEIAKQANSIKSGRILSDIKLLKEMLVKSLGKEPCEEDRVVSDSERDKTPNIAQNEMPCDVTVSEGNAIVELATGDVETSTANYKIPEDEQIFDRMDIAGGEKEMPNSAMSCGDESKSTKENGQTIEKVDSPNTIGETPVTFHNKHAEELSGSMNISDSGRDEMPNNPNIEMPFDGINLESTTWEGQVRANVDTPNTADEITAIIHDEDDEDFSGIMSIYKNSHLHDGIINSAKIENTETKDCGYQYFCLSNL